jgi:N-methylhydantoinase B/oxoprolinase/acetone carboxylase alpha subunit
MGQRRDGRIEIATSGGGGYGPVAQRANQQRADDLADRNVSERGREK